MGQIFKSYSLLWHFLLHNHCLFEVYLIDILFNTNIVAVACAISRVNTFSLFNEISNKNISKVTAPQIFVYQHYN